MVAESLRDIPVIAALQAHHDGSVVSAALQSGQLALTVEPANIVPICRFLKEQQGLVRLSGVTAVDWHPMEPRFELVYLLHSMERRAERLTLKAWLSGEAAEIDSVTPVWRAANWYEREVYDLFGVRFRNHPDMTRIMMPEHWEGHPLRKDFPKYGFKYTYKDE